MSRIVGTGSGVIARSGAGRRSVGRRSEVGRRSIGGRSKVGRRSGAGRRSVGGRSEVGPTHSRYVPSVSRAPASELVLQRGGLPSEIRLPGGASSQ